ncbi:hypothetical protein GFY24_33520 [Nocardia sp. SYP-A9097]|uniref:hypothetical protein n=1 Tax=Nocardia sp. SYP-A9097 TaxID=2663237 RepID=UPI00129B27C3|nr:hypothetical protein [Nocardia sp. SYP-A9097]MRH92299.1 hypothetical protein [Nocardia sp. SYP-A9097]
MELTPGQRTLLRLVVAARNVDAHDVPAAVISTMRQSPPSRATILALEDILDAVAFEQGEPANADSAA